MNPGISVKIFTDLYRFAGRAQHGFGCRQTCETNEEADTSTERILSQEPTELRGNLRSKNVNHPLKIYRKGSQTKSRD